MDVAERAQHKVDQRAAKIIRDYMVSTGKTDPFTLPSEYDRLVDLLREDGLLICNLEECQWCSNPAYPGFSVL